MTLPTSGAISLNDIHIEAGGTTGTQAGINDADIRALIGAASASEIEFADFYGASALTIDTNGGTLSDFRLYNQVVDVYIRYNTDGSVTVDKGNVGSYTNIGWASPTSTGIGSDYEIKATKTSGISNPTGPTLGTWHSLSSSRQWTLSVGPNSYPEVKSCTLSIEIRDAATSTVQDTASIVMEVESFDLN